MKRIVVVGGSIAALTAAGSLRAEGFDGQVTVLSEEPHQPYSRVPLSKGVLAGREPAHSALLPAPGEDIEFRTGRVPYGWTPAAVRSRWPTAPRCRTTGWSSPPEQGHAA
ncbi:toluene 1,2-dioxygenase system [Streptomyces scabiei]|uniref:Toluene 1,2-dioxygenase system n=1 Tax=Streptomyces scabiei TaxID=1930 RepID=A0A124C4R6_STRSC|nr:FAD-dependent oxidoreductase [Streptomyces scabiei]GAQ65283.1 toluene 1,2-dioxygenase system [Streptomyces scabiei]